MLATARWVDQRPGLFAKSRTNRVRVLLVDDRSVLDENMAAVLQRGGFHAVWCPHPGLALDAIQDARPELVVLAMTQPDHDGLSICRHIRSGSGVPILMISTSNDTADVVAGLEAGADDFVTRPVPAIELVARMRTRIRRSTNYNHQVRIGDLTIDIDRQTVNRGDDPLPVTPLEFDLLATLARRPRQVFSREELLHEVWGHRGSASDHRSVNAYVRRLRCKIEQDPEHPQIVQTVRGIGYQAADPW